MAPVVKSPAASPAGAIPYRGCVRHIATRAFLTCP